MKRVRDPTARRDGGRVRGTLVPESSPDRAARAGDGQGTRRPEPRRRMMARGYMGKILNVDLSTGQLSDEPLNEAMCRAFVGGYGIGAKILYDRMRPGVDPLGPDNLLGFFT